MPTRQSLLAALWKRRYPLWIAIGAVLAGGCSEQGASTSPVDPTSQVAVTTDAWLGQWTGPEGTFLLIAGGQGTYELTIRNLDGPQTFGGRAVEGGIEFQRAGITEVIRTTDGVGTGMKWLVDKQNCLVVRPGEGYCRD
jgi:hypothetical protein